MRVRSCIPRLSLAVSDVDVAIDLLQPVPQLVDVVDHLLDAPGHFAHLRLEPIHSQFGVDRSIRTSTDDLRRAAAIDLTLQHAQVPLEAIQPILHGAILRMCPGPRDHQSDRG